MDCQHCGAHPPEQSTYCTNCSIPLVIGQVLGDYRLTGYLGEGAVGYVFQGEHTSTRAPIACKLLRSETIGHSLAVRRFLHEARVSMLLKHPALVRTDAVGQHPSYGPYLIMELLVGETLEQRIERDAPLSWDDAIRIAIELCKGLQYAHEQGIVHRDLKPSNILLPDDQGADTSGKDGIAVKVVDFGLAYAMQSVGMRMTQTNVLLGTPLYMAPEQIKGQPTLQTDIYALGLILFEMLSGKYPFAAESVMALLGQRMLNEAPLVSTVAPQYKGYLVERIIASCLEISTNLRPAQMKDLQAALQEARQELDGEATVMSQRLSPFEESKAPLLRTNVPIPTHPLFGRKSEQQQLTSLLQAGQSGISIIGGAGFGKSDFVRHCAWQVRDTYPGGVWLCGLSDITDLEGLLRAIALPLGMPLQQSKEEQLRLRISQLGRCLLVLDGIDRCKHIIYELLQEWLTQLPHAQFLLTGRHPLGFKGEECIELGPLSAQEGVQLATHWLQEIAPATTYSGIEETLQQLVALVEGCPLALQMALSECEIPITAESLHRMIERLDTRQQTPDHAGNPIVWAALAGSWEALPPIEKKALMQASTFAGSFSLQAASVILLWDEPSQQHKVEGVLAQLLDKGLLQTEQREGQHMRLRILDSVRPFVAQKLDQWEQKRASQAKRKPSAAQQHAFYFASLGRTESQMYFARAEGIAAFQELQVDLDNVCQACEWAILHKREELALHAFLAAWSVMLKQGPYERARKLIERILAMEPLAPKHRAIALGAAFEVAHLLGQMESAKQISQQLEEVLPQLLPEQHPEAWGWWLLLQGHLLLRLGQSQEAEIFYQRSLRHARLHHLTLREIQTHRGMGILQRRAHRDNASSKSYQHAIHLAKTHGYRRPLAIDLNNLGAVSYQRGDWSLAQQCCVEAIQIHREYRDLLGEFDAVATLTAIAIERGILPKAKQYLQRMEDIATYIASPHQQCHIFMLGGLYASITDQPDTAQQHFEQGLLLAKEIQSPMFQVQFLSELGALAIKQQAWSTARTLLQEAISQGEASYPVAFMKNQGLLAIAHARDGQLDTALSLFQQAIAQLPKHHHPGHKGLLLCQHAELLALSGQLQLAQASLQQARMIIRTFQLTEQSALVKSFKEAKDLLKKHPMPA